MKPPRSRTLHELLDEQASVRAGAPAVVSSSGSLSYGQLNEASAGIAHKLRMLGVRRGDRVGILAGNTPEWLQMCFGASAAGATLVAFSTWSTRKELEFLISDSRIRFLFSCSSFLGRDFVPDLAAFSARSADASALEEIVLLDGGSDGFRTLADLPGTHGMTALPPGDAASAGDDALVLYTSGSSANPKAVRLKQFGIVENGFNIGERMGLGRDDRVFVSPPLFWAYGATNALPATITHGAALVLQEKFDPAGAIDTIETHRCTAIYTLPAMTRAIVDHPAFGQSRVGSLRTGLTIGSPEDIDDAIDLLGVSGICNIYGASETYGNCCVTWHHWPRERRRACQGTPLPGNVIRIVDMETGAPVEIGTEGLVEVHGYTMPGYSGESAAHNPAVFTEDGYYRTGDIGRIDPDGAFVFVGRNNEMIKRAGINVSPIEVENVLRSHPGVAQAAVTGVDDPSRGESIVAFVIVERQNAPSPGELFDHCRAVMSKYKMPDRIEYCDALPLTTTGKLQRRELRAMATALLRDAAVSAHG